MKKIISLFMAFVMLLSVTSGLTLTAYAGTTVSGTSGTISWEYDSSTKTMTFSGSGGIYFDGAADRPAPWWGNVNDNDIERIIVSDGITYVNFLSFEYCDNFKEIYLGQDVKEIEPVDWSYYREDFKYFKEINIDKNNVYMTSIDGVVYNKNKTMLIYYPCGRENSEYIIPDGVKSIEANCFSCSTNLKKISIPNSVKTIGYKAFYNTGIINLEIPDSVNLIEGVFGGGAFDDCKNLKTVKIGNNVTKIETFLGCEKLESIEFGNSIEYIGGHYDENLKTIVLPKSIKQIGSETFKDCCNLKDVYYSGNEKDWDKIQIGSGNYGLFTAQIHYNSSPSKQPDVNPTPGGSTGGGSSEITPTPGGSTGGGGGFAPAPTPENTDKKDDDKKPETTPNLPATSSTTNKPATVTTNKPKAKKNSLVVTWKPMNNANGYEVQVATDKKFKKNKKSIIINKKNAKKKTIKNLKKNKKYFVRVRAYKIVDGKKIYGKWSKVKSVKTK